MTELMRRRRALMGVKSDQSCPYITDGLIFWLDGLDVSSNSLWVEKITGKEFTLNDCQKTNNGVMFNGTSSYGVCETENITNGITIEAAYTVNDTTKSFAVFSQKTGPSELNNIILLRNTAGRIYTRATDSYDTQCTHAIQTKELISVLNTTPYAIYNGTQTATGQGNKGPITESGKLYIGRQSSQWYINGTIHSIRIYSRALSQNEMLSNQAVDNERFNMGIFQ